MAKLTKAQRNALVFARTDQWRSASELASTPAACAGLVRRGLLRSTQQREHPLGERPFFYQIYKATEAGREALRSSEPARGEKRR